MTFSTEKCYIPKSAKSSNFAGTGEKQKSSNFAGYELLDLADFGM